MTDKRESEKPVRGGHDNPFLFSRADADALVGWYRENARALPWRADGDFYHILVSEIMLQQTRAEAVVPYYRRFLAALPDLNGLAAASDETLFKLWEGLGYYSRARNLRAAAAAIAAGPDGRPPETYEGVLRLPGVGPYTAGALSSICYDLPRPAVDGNVLRLLSRYCGCDRDVLQPATRALVTAALTPAYEAAADRGALTQALMELGATVCIPGRTPRCQGCPLLSGCAAYKTGRQGELPVRAKARPKTREALTVFILTCGSCRAYTQNKKPGLLADLFALPNIPGALDEAGAAAVLKAWGFRRFDIAKQVGAAHVFTHRIWEMTGYYFTVYETPALFVWADEKTRTESIPLPTAFSKFL